MVRKVLACLLVGFLLTSCDSYTTDMEGKWQLERIESESGISQVDTVWYNFQTSLFQYQIYDQSTRSYRTSDGFNTYEKDKLVLRLFSENILPYTDWNTSVRDFIVEKKNRNALILSSEGKKYYFRRF
ncbi:MAG TPA: hypothetical protein DDZ04_04080 [Parabacteroides sp.]|nr:hypothetical protein [Parabacteroides sp.]